MLASHPAETPHVGMPPRDEVWLLNQLDAIWVAYFTDVPVVNPIEIAWCRPWKTRLGLITLRVPSGTTFIGLNSLLRDPEVPEVLATITIAHELVHYSHGFGSPLPRPYRHPHLGGIVDRDLERRGFAAMLLEYGRWIDQHWFDFYDRQVGAYRPPRTRRSRRRPLDAIAPPCPLRCLPPDLLTCQHRCESECAG